MIVFKKCLKLEACLKDLHIKSLKIAWAVPFPVEGSGGYRTILRRAEYLRDVCGAKCDLFLVPDQGTPFNELKLRGMLAEWFQFDAEGIYMSPTVPNDYDCIIATAYGTAEFAAIQDIECKLYFVQDYEPYFFPDTPGDDHIERATRSYKLGLAPITLGRWLANKLSEDNEEILFSDFGVDPHIYYQEKINKENAICAIYQPEKIRREPKILQEALKIIVKERPDLTIYTFGGTSGPDFGDIDAKHVHLGIVSPNELRKLYNKCKVGICLSSTNPSRIPFEMMACGLPVVEMKGENTIHDIPDGKGALLAESTSEGIASSVLALLSNEEYITEMSADAIKEMKDRTLEKENADFASSLFRVLENSSLRNDKTLDGCIDPEEKELIFNKYNKFMTLPLMKGSAVQIAILLKDDERKFTKISCAIWHEPDQSDLQWILGEQENGKWTFRSKLKPCPKSRLNTLYLHFYDFSMGEDSPYFLFPLAFPFEFKKLVFSCDSYEETIHKDTIEAKVKVRVR